MVFFGFFSGLFGLLGDKTTSFLKTEPKNLDIHTCFYWNSKTFGVFFGPLGAYNLKLKLSLKISQNYFQNSKTSESIWSLESWNITNFEKFCPLRNEHIKIRISIYSLNLNNYEFFVFFWCYAPLRAIKVNIFERKKWCFRNQHPKIRPCGKKCL